MKQAWLVQEYDDEGSAEWKIVFSEPQPYRYARVVPIAYTQLETDNNFPE